MNKFLALVIALAPLYLIRFPLFGFPTTLLELLIVGFLLFSILHLDKSNFKRLKNLKNLNIAIILFVLAGVIGTVISPEPMKAIGLLKAYIIEPVLVFYAIILIINQKQLPVVIKSLFWAAFAVSLFGILQHYTFIHLPLRFWGNGQEVLRITSIFEYPNALSLYLGPLIGFFTALWMDGFNLDKSKTVSAIAILVMTIALTMTFSRGAWIAVAIGLLIILIKQFGPLKTLIPSAILGGAGVLIPSIRQRLSLGLSDPSSSAHFDLLAEGWHKILHHPIFGAGLHGFQNSQVLYPHNIILNFWLEMGLLGLISMIWILFLNFRQYKKRPDVIKWAAVVYLIIVIIHGLVDVPYFKNDLSLLFWFITALFFI